MGFIGGEVGYRLLRIGFPGGMGKMTDGSTYGSRSKIDALLGPDVWNDIIGKTVIDFGCGNGRESIEMAKRGARQVVGLDILERCLGDAERAARNAGVADLCEFVQETNMRVNTIVSIDAFEHVKDPGKILALMNQLLRPGGVVWVQFGPPWYHPFGAHGLSVFPWAHLIFTEAALMRFRSDFKDDGATRFEEIDIGLNKMTTSRFMKLVNESPFRFDWLEMVPIRALRFLNFPCAKEFFTSAVRCRLVRKERDQKQ